MASLNFGCWLCLGCSFSKYPCTTKDFIDILAKSGAKQHASFLGDFSSLGVWSCTKLYKLMLHPFMYSWPTLFPFLIGLVFFWKDFSFFICT